MLELKKCSTCGSNTHIRVNIPDRHYIINDGKIIRDDAWKGDHWDNPQIFFECDYDSEHSIGENSKSQIEIERKFIEEKIYEK